MKGNCIICGREDRCFLYRVKNMAVSMCAEHISDYVHESMGIIQKSQSPLTGR